MPAALHVLLVVCLWLLAMLSFGIATHRLQRLRRVPQDTRPAERWSFVARSAEGHAPSDTQCLGQVPQDTQGAEAQARGSA
jgi:hypothetical protein